MSLTLPGPADPAPSPSTDRTTDRTTDRVGGRRRRAALTEQLLAAWAAAQDPAERRRLRDQIVLANRSVADAVASRYRSRGVPLEDLRQVAYEGLVKAVDRFDPDRHRDLLSYAVPTMRGEVQRYFRDLGWAVRPPRSVQERQYRIHRATADLRQQLGREPQRHEVCAALDLSAEEYDQALAAYGAFQPTSLDRPVDGSDAGAGAGEASYGERMLRAPSDEPAIEARLLLSPVLGRLSPRDRQILQRRFWEDRTQREIGVELGITQMQISRVLARILRDLRDRIGDVER